ncbi:glycosyltransferase family 2 protein, partial [Flavobacterium psychrophilum]|nr:glycosyltransferase family 2 protein [Flavobacterium psychrophilum]
NKENSGFPKGNNIGVAQAKGKYICILNPDTVVSEDTFAKTLAFAESQKNLGIVGCKLIDGTGNFLPESKRGVPTPFVAFTKIFGLYKFSNYFGKYYAQHLSENKTGKVDILVGAFMIMKRELYLEVGGFDEKCFMYSDDIDLSYMVLQKGKSNYYFHQTTVIHYKGESTIKDETYMKRFQEAMNFFYKKHFKVSLFFSLFMKTGIVVFSFIKMFQGKQKARIAPKSYVLISDNKLIKVKLQTELKKDVFLVGKDIFNINYSQNFTNKQPLEFIFDNNYINFKDIMQLMQLKEYKKHTFKILPQTTDYLIGSNSSNDRGGVILMSDFKN